MRDIPLCCAYFSILIMILKTCNGNGSIECSTSIQGMQNKYAHDSESNGSIDVKAHWRSLMSILEMEPTRDCLQSISSENLRLISPSSRTIYFDLGCRELDSTFQFFERYPNASSFDVFCFEADPKYGPLYKKLQIKHPRVTFVNKAVGDFPQNLFLTSEATGSSIAKANVGTLPQTQQNGVVVPVISLAAFILNATEAAVKYGDKLVIKVDVEGMEFAILHQMARLGVLGLVSELLLECHYGEGSERITVTKKNCKQLVRRLQKAFDGTMDVVMWNSVPLAKWSNPKYIETHGGFYPT